MNEDFVNNDEAAKELNDNTVKSGDTKEFENGNVKKKSENSYGKCSCQDQNKVSIWILEMLLILV